ncbi:MAG: peptidyl-prolyl cis-trans isomerase [Gemmatimonadetes bacterium]|nr:peptidyl-prolyl cis-trans isomerase [Gemmatimonadota bacterium]
MMRAMRASAKWIMGAVAFTFVGYMVFEVGMDASGRGSAAPEVLAKVNGYKIDDRTFYAALRNEQERIRQERGAIPVSLEEQRALEDQVLEQLVQEIVLRQELRRRGITVSDREVIDAARTSPPPEILSMPQFQTEGQFDLQKYQRFISSSADPAFLLALEARYRDEIPRLKFFDQITAGVYVSDSELWQMFRDQNDSVTVEALALYPPTVVPDSDVTIGEAEIEAYYAAQSDEFERPATAYLSFLTISRRPNAADSAAALERAQSARAEIVDGAEFDAVARRESADSISALAGGDLGDVPHGRFVPEFENAVLALGPGELSEPVLTQFGYHIIRLESKTDTSFHAQHILLPIELFGDHLDEVESRADTFDLFAAEQDDPGALDDVADRLGLTVAAAPPLLEGTRLQLDGFLIGDAAVWAFGSDIVEGQISPVIETSWAYYIFRLDSLVPTGIPPLDQVRDQVRRAAVSAVKETRTRALAQEIAADLEAGMTLEETARRRELSTRTVGPFTRYNPALVFQGVPEAAGAAFAMGVGQTSGPVSGPLGTFFVRPIRKTVADSSVFVTQLERQRIQALQQERQRRVQLVLASLRSAADVQDLRDEYARRLRAADQGLIPNPIGF